jgi:RHS repeat-associated protein
MKILFSAAAKSINKFFAKRTCQLPSLCRRERRDDLIQHRFNLVSLGLLTLLAGLANLTTISLAAAAHAPIVYYSHGGEERSQYPSVDAAAQAWIASTWRDLGWYQVWYSYDHIVYEPSYPDSWVVWYRYHNTALNENSGPWSGITVMYWAVCDATPTVDGFPTVASHNPATFAAGCPTKPVERPKNCGGGDCNGGGGNLQGNPINIGIGNKYQVESDYQAPGLSGLGFVRRYNSQEYFGTALSPARALGWRWRSSFERSIKVYSTSTITSAYVLRPDARVLWFTLTNGQWQPDTDIADQLVGIYDANNNLVGWKYIEAATEGVETYDATGKLLSIASRSGIMQTLAYSDGTTGANGGYVLDASGVATSTTLPAGLLLRVTDSFGHMIGFGYDTKGRIVTMTDPASNVYHYAYDASGNLMSVTYPDNKIRTYKYNEAGPVPANHSFPNALTGILDENNQRFATFKYDTQGRAISSEHNLPGNVAVEKISITYATNGANNVTSSTVTDALNATRTYSFTNVLGVVKNSGVAQSCTNCGGNASKATTYDVNGNIASRTDFNGNKTTYAYDLARNLETSRTEGLTSAGLTTPQTRTITTTWHSTYRLPLSIAEPGRTTTYTYDTSGNVLTKTIADTALSTSRTWTYTYNSLGQILTSNGPRTDVSDITTYTYYTSASSTSGSVHSIGDLATVTNALGHITSITNYDLNGRPLTITDANGIVTTLTYWPRGWLKTRTVNGAQTTLYDYDGVGQLIKVTLPDGSFLSYTYDTAHRLTDIADGSLTGGLSGNKIHYTLDAMGNRTQEDTKDPSNTILKTRSRVFDALNRLQKDIGGTSPSTQITQYGYDNNGNLQTITDPLSHITTNGYDALNRLIQITDPATPTAGVTNNTYNARDQLTSVSDPRLVATNYTVDALGNVSVTQSPDSGTTNNVYDAAGNVMQKTDARGIASNYAYDALNRLTGITYPANPSDNVSFIYDYDGFDGASKGRLSYIGDADGFVIVGAYDAYGNVLTKADWLSTATTQTDYVYDAANRVIQVTYPSGRIVTYTRNALGQITQVQMRDNATASLVTLIGNATYKPFGPLASLSFNNGVTTTLLYDADYRVTRITATSTPNWDYVYGYDAASNLTAFTDQIGSNSKLYSYDNLNRLTFDNKPSAGSLGLIEYQYDKGGNRTLWKQGTGSVFNYAQTYASTSNRESQFNTTAMMQDAAGNLSSYGTKLYSYNSANRLSQAVNGSTTASYRYNGLGQRTTKLVTVGTTTTTTHYDYDRDGKYLDQIQLNSDATYAQSDEYIWLDNLPIAQVHITYGTANAVASQQLTYIHADHLNTSRIMTDATRKVVWSWNSEAYGKNAPATDPDGDSVQNKLDLRFPGQIADSEMGFYYNMNRYYDPVAGRYTQSDPIGLNGGLNTYAYVGGNPISLIDPLGLEAELCTRQFYPVPVPYARHCFVRFNGNNGDTLSFDNNGVHPDPNPKGASCQKTDGDEDDCVKREIKKCQASNYRLTGFNCCHCAEQAMKTCGIGVSPKSWPNWPVNPGPQSNEPAK